MEVHKGDLVMMRNEVAGYVFEALGDTTPTSTVVLGKIISVFNIPLGSSIAVGRLFHIGLNEHCQILEKPDLIAELLKALDKLEENGRNL